MSPGGANLGHQVFHRHLSARCTTNTQCSIGAGIRPKVGAEGYLSMLCRNKVMGVVKFRLICFTVLIASLRKKKNNVLRLLLTLECLVLFLFIVLCFLGEIYFRVIFLSVGACEAAVGLGCLVGLIRLAGQNHISFTECGPYLPCRHAQRLTNTN